MKISYVIFAIGAVLTISACSDKDAELASADKITKSPLFTKENINIVEYSEATDTLSFLAKDCRVDNFSGTPITFRTSKIKSSDSFTSTEVCEYAGQMADDSYRTIRDAMQVGCDIADNIANRIGGGSYSVAKSKIKQIYEPEKAQPYLKLLNTCENKESRIQLMKETVSNTSIYSVGMIKMNGNSCKAYLEQLETQGTKLTRYYRLMGTGACASLDSDKLHYFHPEERADSITLGKLIKDRYDYDGDYPAAWIFKDKEYSFN